MIFFVEFVMSFKILSRGTLKSLVSNKNKALHIKEFIISLSAFKIYMRQIFLRILHAKKTVKRENAEDIPKFYLTNPQYENLKLLSDDKGRLI